MKFQAVAMALMAAATVQAAAVPEADYLSMDVWCAHPGQGCAKIKRAADISTEVKRSAEALAEAMAEAHPEAMSNWCAHPGQGCAKVKRSADAVAEVRRSADALAEAMASLKE